ncbi:hypothetical protein Tco_1337737 [Tanacetum coccineum]
MLAILSQLIGQDKFKGHDLIEEAQDGIKGSDEGLECTHTRNTPQGLKRLYMFLKLTNTLDEEIISTKIDPHHFNAESDLIESLLNRNTLIISSPKFDSLLEEFSGELAHINLIPPGINEADLDPEEEIRLVEKLLYDNW